MHLTRKIVTLVLLVLTGLGLGLAFVNLDQANPQTVASAGRRWTQSTHADAQSESFTHWDEDEPPIIPVACAGCHSTYGYHDYMGVDGSAVRSVDEPAETGTLVYCVACHSPEAEQWDRVRFPSGEEVADLGPEARCMVCHQGRKSTDDVNEAVAGIDDDEVSEELSFINVHYAIAAATQWGAQGRVGYQYADRGYAGYYPHVENLNSCVECHDPHSQRVSYEQCSPCHFNVVNFGDLEEIRAGAADYDGDGDVTEGVAYEIEALHARLYEALQAYADTVVGTPIVYADTFPYFFVDTNGNGEAEDEEAQFGNQYKSWTPRLVRAAYNYQFVAQDSGAYAHNPLYATQLLYDSIADLGERVSVDLDNAVRPDETY